MFSIGFREVRMTIDSDLKNKRTNTLSGIMEGILYGSGWDWESLPVLGMKGKKATQGKSSVEATFYSSHRRGCS